MMWAAGSLAAMSSIAYPAISAMVSCNADADQQGISQHIAYMFTCGYLYFVETCLELLFFDN